MSRPECSMSRESSTLATRVRLETCMDHRSRRWINSQKCSTRRRLRLSSPSLRVLVSKLEATRWTGRPGYPIKSMVGMALAKSIYAVPTWTRLVALVAEQASLRAAVLRVYRKRAVRIHASMEGIGSSCTPI